MRASRTCTLRSATVRYADHVVLREVDLPIEPTERLAVIGDNGSGKSTLLALLAGRVPLVAGERRVHLPGGFAFAEQRPSFPSGASVADALDALLADLRNLESEIVTASDAIAAAVEEDQPALLAHLARLTDRFEARDGYGVDQRVAAALDQLGLGGLEHARPVADLSGGERARLALAAAMSSESELLLLDEPTNDLDDAGVAWLEDRLERHRGALVVVTHDRAFLERFATSVLVVADARIRRYGNGYAGYLASRAAERRRLLTEHEAWRADLARNEALIAANAFRLDAIPRKAAKAGFGHGAFKPRGRDHGAMGRIRNAKERVTRLNAMPAPRPADPLRFAPAFAERPAVGPAASAVDAPLLTVEDLRLGGTATADAGTGGPRLEVEALQIHAGDRWLVSGPNGAGKTTLLRVLAGHLAPDAGSVVRVQGTRVATLRQDLASAPGGTLLAAFAQAIDAYPEDARERLAGLGLFEARDLDRPVVDLSVGQRRRLDLALVMEAPSDVLLLDEPTNHLAPELVEQLEDALVDHPGAVITVTHDRRWRQRASAAGGVRRLEVAPGGRVTVLPASGDPD
ncbi:ABC-F family ATP-binding cassette domain-containing protein [Knoellia sinensis]|uniref:ABC-F family ATP-binding cassette domain-containing protein n=1 Tax=Knoellia sinensis TaxID=136100 RepID=UPI0006919A74